MKGRKAIPTKIIDLRGGTKLTHRSPRTQEPKPPQKMPSCPSHLDALARKEWRRAGKILNNIGLMTELDRATLAAYCEAYSRWVEATLKVKKKGMIFVNKKTLLPYVNPYMRIARDAYDQMIKVGILLGMSPSSRASLKVDKDRKPDRIEEFMRRKGANG